MAAVGEIIAAADYNTIRNKVANILGVGSASSGYGQTLNSETVNPLDPDVEKRKITKAQWDDLRFDIINARVHQVDVTPILTVVSTTDPIKYGPAHPNFQYNSVANDIITDKFVAATTQVITSAAASDANRRVQLATAWANSVSCTLTMTFASADQARYFWNSGGRLRFSSSRSGGALTAQNTSWTNLLAAVGSVDFTAASSTLNTYTLTTSYQPWYTSASSSPYNNNDYTIRVKADTENSSGTARVFQFEITWRDGYVDYPGPTPPGDSIDGTLSLTVDEIYAEGILLPGNLPSSFAITRPVYSITTISGS